MRRFLILFLVLGFFGCKGLKAIENKGVTKTVVKKPVIEVIPKSYDFGKVKQHKIVDTIFKIVNKGEADLILGNIITSCGCTAVLINSKVIHPGKSGNLKVTLETRNYNKRIKRVITINSNDPETPQKHITIFANVVED
jgi:hypothetical protein